MSESVGNPSKIQLMKSYSAARSVSATVEEIDLKLLKFQNIAMANKLDFLKKEVKTLKTSKESLELRLKNSETYISYFGLMWGNFLTDIEFVHALVKKTEEDKLATKFSQAFQFVTEMMKIGDGIKDNQNDISKQIKNKIETLMKNIQNIYSEIFIELQKSQEKINRTTGEILKMELNDMARHIFVENQSLGKRIIDMEQSFNQLKSRLKEENQETLKQAEESKLKSKLQEITQENENLKTLNECLTRRLRLQGDYNAPSIENQMNIEEEKYECICGANIEGFTFQKNSSIIEKQENLSLSPPSEKNEEKNSKSMMDIERPKDEKEEIATTMSKMKISLEILQRQNDELIKEKVDLRCELEKLKLEKNNFDEKLFSSELFKNLVQQTQDLLKYVNNLRSKLNSASKKVLEIERQRAEELTEIYSKFNEEKEKLIQEIDKSHSTHIEKQKEEPFDINQFTAPYITALSESNKINDSLKNENQHLRQTLSEYKVKYQGEYDLNISNMSKLEQLTLELTTIKLQINGHIPYEKFDLKRLSFKEYIIQMNELILKYNPELKKRFDEINIYTKTRETKIEHIENNLRKANNEIKHKQKQIEELIKEIDITAKIYNDLVITNKKLTEQIKESDEIKAKILTEKAQDKKIYEQEKMNLNIKLSAEKETIKNVNTMLADISGAKKSLESIKINLETEVNSLKQYNQELKNSLQESYTAQLSLSKEIELMRKTKEDQEKTLSIYIKDLENKKNENAINAQDPVVINRLILLEHRKYKSMMICTICDKRDKEVVLKNCYHTFCKECIDKNLQMRKRACPNCRTKFGAEDVREIFWN